MKPFLKLLFLSFFFLNGCATLYTPNITTVNSTSTNVVLSKANFKVLKFISETHRSTTIFGFGAKNAAVASARAKMFSKAKMQGSQAIINEHVEIKFSVTYALFIVIYNVTVSGTLIEFTE